MTDLKKYLAVRARLIAVTAFLGLLSTCWDQPAPSDDKAGLLHVLENEGRLVVGNVVWEPSRGLFTDWLIGRPLLFEGSDGSDPQARRDIYRALLRVSPEGRILDIGRRHNLTRTRSADEFDLGARYDLAWFASRGNDSPVSFTFVDLKGEPKPATQVSVFDRLQLGISRLLETGTWAGLGKSDLFTDEGELTIQISEEIQVQAGEKTTTLSASDLFSTADRERSAASFALVKRTREPVPWLHWAADTGRHFVGSGAIAWAEGRAFSLIDSFHQVSHSVTSKAATPSDKPPLPLPPPPRDGTAVFPPENIQVQNARSLSDGVWKPVARPVLPALDPPLFYRTVIHPDRERPYAELHLVAMDMRQLTLGIGAGYEDPHPDTGPPGSGEIPEDVAPQVVATFNGAFKVLHGRYGMKAEGRLLVEPVVGAATVRIDASESAGFGTWRAEHQAKDTVALRQNLDPLVADGKVNPHARRVWGDQRYGEGVAVERSAICYHSSGHILYGWATEATGESLAQGMATAGCVYAIHLDMNPGHCAFSFNKIKSVKPLVAEGEPLDARMKINPNRFVRWSPKDFFYLTLRNGLPQDDPLISWQVAPGDGPHPLTIPAIFLGEKRIGELHIELDRVDTSRLSFHVVPGSAELSPNSNPPEGNPGAALIAWGLGHRTHGTRAGLTLGASVIAPLHGTYANLLIQNGKLLLEPPGRPQSEGREPQTQEGETQVVQLPALARDGALLPLAHELGGNRRRSALCLDNKGSLLIARMTHDTSAPLAQVLVDLGCSLVVDMDRGSHSPPRVERAGTPEPPHSGYEQTMLYGLSAPMKPLTHLF